MGHQVSLIRQNITHQELTAKYNIQNLIFSYLPVKNSIFTENIVQLYFQPQFKSKSIKQKDEFMDADRCHAANRWQLVCTVNYS